MALLILNTEHVLILTLPEDILVDIISYNRREGDDLQGGEDQVVHLLMGQVAEQGRLK